MLNYSFFNSVIDQEGNPDRPFDANDFSKYFGTLIKNGVFPNPSTNFQIQGDQGNMSVKAERGLAWIEGHLAYDDSVFILNIDPADSVLDRIDRVVLRLDTLERCIKWVVKKGEPSAKPIAKELQRDADAYEIGIADVAVNHGIINITQSMVKDLRLNTELCGIVTGQVTQIDTTTLYAQLEGFKDVEGTCIKVFYPLDGVSAIQQQQMVSQEGKNVKVVGIHGNFDDAQSAVKVAFGDKMLKEVSDQHHVFLSSANSINVGRLIPQIVYYFHSYFELVRSKEIEMGDQVNFCVPSGNF